MFRFLDRVTFFIIARYTGLRRFASVAAASKDPGTLAFARAGRLLYRNNKLARVFVRLHRARLLHSLRHLELQVYTIALAETLRQDDDLALLAAGVALP